MRLSILVDVFTNGLAFKVVPRVFIPFSDRDGFKVGLLEYLALQT